MKTWVPKGKDLAELDRKWYIIDASGVNLGRMATSIAYVLTGKNKPTYTPHMDMGDHVIVINADKVRLTGEKLTKREHFSHSGYPGGQKRRSPADILAKRPGKLVQQAVRGMLPKNRLGRKILKNLHIFVDGEHTLEAQKPKTINLNSIK